MAIEALSRPLLILLCFLFPTSSKAESSPSLCFDLNHPNLTLLKPAPSRFPEIGKEVESFGRDEKTGYDWATASGRVNKSVDEILEKLRDPMTTRDPETTKVETDHIKINGALEKQHVKIVVKPIFFLTLEWEEDWLYTIKSGKPGKLRAVVISYQKTSGTSHIEHFCGTILIQKISSTSSGVFLAEEIKAARRSAEDVYRGLMGTIRTLRK